jgi:hypothetical protein
MPCYPRDSAVQGQEVELQIQFFDNCSKKVAADETPMVQIRDLDGNIILAFTDVDVEYLGEGLYQYKYRVPDNADAGAWIDEWRAVLDTAVLDTSFGFTVVTPTSVLTPTIGQGKIQISDDIDFNFSDEELHGINVLLKFLKSRLRSTGIKPVRDQFGAFTYDGYGILITEECNVFPDDILIALLCQALSEFNSVPFFTTYAFSDQIIYTTFSHIIVEAAYVFALSSQALLERGRDFTISDGGISYQPPQFGDFLQTHYSTWLSSYRERLQFIKNSIRPGPRSFGSASNLGSAAPALTRLRHLRSRKLL